MTEMLPPPPAESRSLTGVASDLLASLRGDGGYGKASSVVVVLVDGLGAIQLREHAGHARTLSSALSPRSTIQTVFPSTTAAALTSLTTGASPGQHGLVGYSVRVPGTGTVSNQLRGWGLDGVEPASWQRSETMFTKALAGGFDAYAVGPSEYATSGFTAASLRDAQYIGEADIQDRVRRALDLAGSARGRLVYCYIPELDQSGHKMGVASDRWLATLEEIDSALRASVPAGVGMVVTSDHGMVNVPQHRHVLLQDGDDVLDGVSIIAGEPRMLHLYVEQGEDAAATAARWQSEFERQAIVATREQVVSRGMFGEVAGDVLPRIGDVLVMARGVWAFYDDREAEKRPQSMIGQHGSITTEETKIPLLRFGTFA